MVRAFALSVALLAAILMFSLSRGESALATAPCPVTAGWTQLTSPEPPGPQRDARSWIPPYSLHGIQNLAQPWDDSGVIYGGAPFGLYRSDDCGLSWSRLPYPRDDAGFTFLETNPPDVTIPNPVWSFAPAAVSPSGRLMFYRTASYYWASDDDGQTWRIAGFPAVSGHLAFGPRGTAWMSGFRRLRDQSDSQPVMAMSTDEGKTWAVATALEYPPQVNIPEVFVVDPLDEAQLIIGRGDGRVTQSQDWGRTEIEIARFSGPISAVTVSPDRQRMWVAAGDGSLAESKDAGGSWSVVAGSPGVVQRNGLHFLRGSRGEAVFALTVRGELWFYRDAPSSNLAAPAQVP